MKKSTLIALTLFLLLTTINSHQKISVSKFKIEEINIENNYLIKEEDIKKTLSTIYNKNLFLLRKEEIKGLLTQNSLIEGFKVKKKYPNKLRIRIFEKQPVAILFEKKKKYYLSEKIDLIEIKDLPNFRDLPHVYANKNDFKIFYNNLMRINFPFEQVKKFTLYESGRWDLKMINNVTIKLPPKNYIQSLENYLSLLNKKDFKKFSLYDYRINDQLILK